MADMGRRKPAADESLHTLPLHAPVLTPPFKSAMPEVTDRKAEVGQSVPIPRYSEVSKMPAHNGLQPSADFRNRIMHTPASRRVHAPLHEQECHRAVAGVGTQAGFLVFMLIPYPFANLLTGYAVLWPIPTLLGLGSKERFEHCSGYCSECWSRWA